MAAAHRKGVFNYDIKCENVIAGTLGLMLIIIIMIIVMIVMVMMVMVTMPSSSLLHMRVCMHACVCVCVTHTCIRTCACTHTGCTRHGIQVMVAEPRKELKLLDFGDHKPAAVAAAHNNGDTPPSVLWQPRYSCRPSAPSPGTAVGHRLPAPGQP